MTVTVQEAEARFDELIARVEAGGEIVIVDGDIPVARLVALTEEEKKRAALSF